MMWIQVAEAPEYEVSEAGEIRSMYTRRPLKGGIDKDGYRKLVLCTGGQRIHRRVAALVCAAFHGPRPAGHVVRHLDGSRNNDAAANLAWGTQAQNIADKAAHGTAQRGERHPRAKLTRQAVLDIRRSEERGAALAAKHGVTRGTISAVRTRRLWAHVE
jgi:hypothetical protein